MPPLPTLMPCELLGEVLLLLSQALLLPCQHQKSIALDVLKAKLLLRLIV